MAGGVPAGRLSIELVAEIARLQADLDKAKRMVKAASQQIANDAKAANDNLSNIGKGAKLASHHTTNLAFQFQDLGIQMAAAAQSSHPLKMAFTAILQQGSQIGGIMMQAGIGVRGLVTEIGGMIGRFAAAHPVLAAIAVVAGVVAAALKIVAVSFDDGGGEAYARSLGLTNKEMKKMGDLGVTMGDVLSGLWKTIYDGLNLGTVFAKISDAAGKAFAAIKSGVAEAFGFALKWIENYISTVYAAFVGTGRAIASLATAAKQALSGDVQGALATVKAIPAGYSTAFKQAHSVVDGFVTSAGKKLAKFGKDFRANTLDARNDRIRADADKLKADRTPKSDSDSRAETLAREIKANEALIAGLYKVADAYAVSEAAGLKAEITAKATAAGIKKQADVEAYVAQQIRLTVAERTRDAAKDAATLGAQTAARAKLNDQVKAGLITSAQAATMLQQEGQLRPYLIALDLAQGEAKTKLAAAIERLRKELKEANDEAERTRDQQRADQMREEIALLDREIVLTEQIGAQRIAAYKNLRGEALRKELAKINLEQQKALILMRAMAVAEQQRRDGQTQTAEQTMERARKEIEALEKGAAIEEAVRKAETARARALETAHDIADVIGGRIGDAVNSILSALDRFDSLLSSANPVLKALGMAGLGGAAAKATGGSGLGGSIGGALGGKLGEKFLSKGLEKLMGGLGQFAGPLGAIAGGVLGGVIGGLLKKVKKGSQTIEIMAGEAVKTSLVGNSAKLKAAASKMADGLISGLLSIADQLGGDLGNGIKVSIGQRDKTFRVDLQGLGRTKNMPKFDTEAEAIQFAISEVIKQGAIIGLRAGTEALLKGEGDLEARLQNAMKFEGVFKELEKRANPTKAALGDIAKEFDKLIDIFEEAGASADDYAKLQELMAIRQREVIAEAFEPIRAMLDDLKSKADTAADAVRTKYQEIIDRESEAVQAYKDAVSAQEEAARQARAAAQQRWLDIVTTGYNEEIDRLKSAIDTIGNSVSALRSEAEDLADAADRLRGFSASIFGAVNGQRAASFSQDAVRSAAQAGDVNALEALKDVAISTATDRASMLRNLAMLKVETDRAADSFQGRANAVESQIAAAEAQQAALEKQIAGIEQQIELAKTSVEKLEEIAETGLSVEEAFKQMQTATAAADQARATMDRLSELNQTELTFGQAVAEYEAAKAARDDLLQQVTAAGFSDLIAVQQQTGAQMVAALSQAAAQAAQATSTAAAAISAAQAAQEAAAKAANDNPWEEYLRNIPFFAAGGSHSGGLRIVGENGPELEATGPARYFSNSRLGGMMGGPSAGDIGSATAEALRPIIYPMVKAMIKLDDRTRRWDGDGMPTERDVA